MAKKQALWTALDIDQELKEMLKSVATEKDEEKLEKLTQERERRKEINRSQGIKKRKLQAIIKDPKKSRTEKRVAEAELDVLDQSYPLPLEDIDNEANRLLGKDFEFTVSVNSFGETFKVKASDLIKRESPGTFILEKWKRRIEKELEDEEDEHKKYILGKLIEKVDKNIQLIDEDILEYPDEAEYEQIEIENPSKKEFDKEVNEWTERRGAEIKRLYERPDGTWYALLEVQVTSPPIFADFLQPGIIDLIT